MSPAVNAVGTGVAVEAGALDPVSAALAEKLVDWLETAVGPEQLFAPGVLGDLSVPLWRLQASGAAELFSIRSSLHPWPGRVRVEHLDRTSRGFLIQFEERWAAEGQQWYAREMMHAVVDDGLVTEISVYCTGDWDEAVQRRHVAEVQLTRS
jgi:hypothetical protein